jgi:hypothetical protein
MGRIRREVQGVGSNRESLGSGLYDGEAQYPSCLLLLSSGSSYFLFIEEGCAESLHTHLRKQISCFPRTNHPLGPDFEKRVSTEPIPLR